LASEAHSCLAEFVGGGDGAVGQGAGELQVDVLVDDQRSVDDDRAVPRQAP